MTLPTCYSWSPVGERLSVAAEAPQGRRVNALAAYFSAGPLAGEFEFAGLAKLPARGSKRKPLAQRAAEHGLRPEEVGGLDSDRLIAFCWQLAGRPASAGPDWQRERPLFIALDNYSVHQSERVQAELPRLSAAQVQLWYLPSYSPELSDIEPIWQSVKHHDLRQRSFRLLGDLLRAVQTTLAQKAVALRHARSITDHLLPLAA
jgi:DDE superfamily endonuclease